MKRLLTIVLALLIPFCSCAQKKGFKLVEKSGQKPEWVGQGSVKGFIIVQTNKATLEEAKAEAMQKVRAEIAESVATNVQRTVNAYTQRVVEDGNSTTHQTIAMESTSKIAKMPAIQGVSITKAETYNEFYRHKKTGESYYVLYVKYPFSQFDLVELVTAYEKYEQEINDKIKGYEEGLDNIKNVEEIDANITALSGLAKELDDDPRVDRITSIINRYLKAYDNISIEIVENNPNKLVVRLVYNGKSVTTSQMPRVSSNCADQFNTSFADDKIVVTYNSDYCYAQDDNKIEIRFKFGSKYVKKEAFFKLK